MCTNHYLERLNCVIEETFMTEQVNEKNKKSTTVVAWMNVM
jgi:hypothetical protein